MSGGAIWCMTLNKSQKLIAVSSTWSLQIVIYLLTYLPTYLLVVNLYSSETYDVADILSKTSAVEKNYMWLLWLHIWLLWLKIRASVASPTCIVRLFSMIQCTEGLPRSQKAGHFQVIIIITTTTSPSFINQPIINQSIIGSFRLCYLSVSDATFRFSVRLFSMFFLGIFPCLGWY